MFSSQTIYVLKLPQLRLGPQTNVAGAIREWASSPVGTTDNLTAANRIHDDRDAPARVLAAGGRRPVGRRAPGNGDPLTKV
jgi:hypothetical protein